MLSDSLLNFAQDGVALNTGAAGNYMIGDQVDLGVDARGIGTLTGLSALWVVITVATAATSAGAATAKFQLVTDSDPAFGTPTVLAETSTFELASLVVDGDAPLAVIGLPSGVAYERYIGLRQVTGTAAFTAGAIDAVITPTVPNRYAYAQGAGAGLGAS